LCQIHDEQLFQHHPPQQQRDSARAKKVLPYHRSGEQGPYPSKYPRFNLFVFTSCWIDPGELPLFSPYYGEGGKQALFLQVHPGYPDPVLQLQPIVFRKGRAGLFV
jgi:hypothetical protein